MMRYARGLSGVGLGLVALLLIAPAVPAKGIPTEVEITGPGIAAPIRETSPLALPTLGIVGFMDTARTIAPAADGDPSYEMTRDGGERVRFYPSPGGGCGIVLYIGDPGRIGTEYDNHWYRATCSGDVVFRTVLAMHGIAVAGDRPPLTQIASEATARVGNAPIATPAVPPVVSSQAAKSAPAPLSAATHPDASWPRWLLPLAGMFGVALGVALSRALIRRT